MSTSISTTQAASILPKPIVTLKKAEEKPPRLQRASSIDTIKRINTYICSPQSYILPAMLTTWLKTSQTGLQTSTEKTIFMFRSLIIGSILQKVVSIWARSEIQKKNADLPKISAQFATKFLTNFSTVIISVAFYLIGIVLAVQVAFCAFLLNQCVVPIGMHFLLTSAVSIAGLGYKLNCSDYLKSTHPKTE